jgi:hypothetical protein
MGVLALAVVLLTSKRKGLFGREYKKGTWSGIIVPQAIEGAPKGKAVITRVATRAHPIMR